MDFFIGGRGSSCDFSIWQTPALRHPHLQCGYIPIVKQQSEIDCKKVVAQNH